MKVLNLYAGIGGNRKLWTDVEVTAVESEQYIADAYKKLYPDDTVVVGDAHAYLLEHHKEFDFIWSSPPCPTHSVTNGFLYAQGVIRYPDMKLYEEIIFLKHFFKGKWVVENVKSYYEPLVNPTAILDRHYVWSNFYIPQITHKKGFNVTNARASTRKTSEDDLKSLEDYHGIYLPDTVKNKRKLLRNAVWPESGLHVMRAALKETKQEQLL